MCAATPTDSEPQTTKRATQATSDEGPSPELLNRAHEILRRVPLVDGHNDVAWQYRHRVENRLEVIDFAGDTTLLDPPMHTDLPRMRAGNIGGQFWAAYVPADLPEPEASCAVFEQVDLIHRLIRRHPEYLELALTADDVERIHGADRIASLIGVEGGYAIRESLGILRRFHAAGARYMTLTHSLSTGWADSATDAPRHGGLTDFGREVIREMNRLGMMVDLSHVADTVMDQVLEISEAPVAFTHSSARALAEHPRNVPDEILRRVPGNGGLVMVTFVPAFLSRETFEHLARIEGEKARLAHLYPQDEKHRQRELEAWQEANPIPPATLSQAADHIDHVREVAGIDHVGIGGDMDGIAFLPEGLGGADRYPHLLAELLRRGYSDDDVEKIAGRNLLRVLRGVEARAEGSASPPG